MALSTRDKQPKHPNYGQTDRSHDLVHHAHIGMNYVIQKWWTRDGHSNWVRVTKAELRQTREVCTSRSFFVYICNFGKTCTDTNKAHLRLKRVCSMPKDAQSAFCVQLCTLCAHLANLAVRAFTQRVFIALFEHMIYNDKYHKNAEDKVVFACSPWNGRGCHTPPTTLSTSKQIIINGFAAVAMGWRLVRTETTACMKLLETRKAQYWPGHESILKIIRTFQTFEGQQRIQIKVWGLTCQGAAGNTWNVSMFATHIKKTRKTNTRARKCTDVRMVPLVCRSGPGSKTQFYIELSRNSVPQLSPDSAGRMRKRQQNKIHRATLCGTRVSWASPPSVEVLSARHRDSQPPYPT